MAYEPGVLRAEGFRNGELVAVDEVCTTGKMAGLSADVVNTEISEEAWCR